MFKFILLLIPFLLYGSKPDLLLLKTYKDQNISGWVMSEKLDGIRAYWDGAKLLTKNGKQIYAPKWFTKDYPLFPIDGELWSKEKDFENISSIVRDKIPSNNWKQIKHYIFEVPNAKGNLYQRLDKLHSINSRYIKRIKQIKIKNKQHLQKYFKETIDKGGEGIVVRDPSKSYISKRTSSALKVKKFQDAECEVIKYTKGNGKYKDMMGSLVCKLQNNIVFKIGSGFTKQQRIYPPNIGDIVTFKYQEFTKYGIPRFPVFLRIRYTNKQKDKSIWK